MALIPSARYPSQTATGDAAYPQGKARDDITDGDFSGTPLEKDWVNDIWGFEQALLDLGGITPSGTPDGVGASDYIAGLMAQLTCITPALSNAFSGVFGPTGISNARVVPLFTHVGSGTATIGQILDTVTVRRKILRSDDLHGNIVRLLHNAAPGEPGNILTPDGNNFDIYPGGSVEIYRDDANDCWRILHNVQTVRTAETRWVGASYGVSSDEALNGVAWLPLAGSDPSIRVCTGTTRADISIPIDHVLPDDAIITGLTVWVKPATAEGSAGNRMSAQLVESGNAGMSSSSATANDNGTTAAQGIPVTASMTVDKTSHTYQVVVRSTAAVTLDQCFGVQVAFTTMKKFVG